MKILIIKDSKFNTKVYGPPRKPLISAIVLSKLCCGKSSLCVLKGLKDLKN